MQDLIHFIEQHLFSCSFKEYLGIECPGCGMQRAFIALLRGDLILSFRMNPSLIPFLVTLTYCFAHIKWKFSEGARNIVFLFSLTVGVMVVNFVIKLLWFS